MSSTIRSLVGVCSQVAGADDVIDDALLQVVEEVRVERAQFRRVAGGRGR